MKIKIASYLIITLLASVSIGAAQQTPQLSPEEQQKLVQGLKYQQGEISLQGGLAKLNIPKEFNYLGPEDANTVLVKLWHNPPSFGENVLGLIMPANTTPLDENGWAVTVRYQNDGYIKDDDAASTDYNKLLVQMKADTQENNKKRAEEGYPPVELIGWAASPHYDAATHKLYWARELKFGSDDAHALNYDIRILGRQGMLVLSVIGDMSELHEIEQSTPQILAMVDFNQGNRYADFDPKMDKVATYGIAALVAGGIATKLGIFKLVWVFILAAKKFVIIGIAAIGAWFKKMFGGKKAQGSE